MITREDANFITVVEIEIPCLSDWTRSDLQWVRDKFPNHQVRARLVRVENPKREVTV